MDPLLLKYLGEKYSDEERANVEEQARQAKNNSAFMQAASGFGDALAGRSSSDTAQRFEGIRQGIDRDTVGKFDQGRKNALMDYDLKNKLQADERNQDLQKKFDDMNSDETNTLRMYGAKIGLPPEKLQQMNGTQIKNLSPMFKEMYELDQKRLDRQDNKEERRALFGMRREDQQNARAEKKVQASKLSEKQVEAFTDFDNAETDLRNVMKQLESNKSFAGPIEGRIPELFSGSDSNAFRSAVGKYKDAYRKAITGAGASEKEIKILESRLPSENDRPADFQAKAQEALKGLYQHRSNLAENLSKIGKDTSEFRGSPKDVNKQKQVVKEQVNQKTGQRRVVYDDGTSEILGNVAGGQ